MSTLLLLLLCTSSQAAVRLTLSVDPPSSLPALPPTFHIVASNESDGSAQVSPRICLKVVPPTGDPFIAIARLSEDDLVTTLRSSSPLVLGPHESRDLTLWASPASPPWFELDSRLYPPGTYRFQLIADADLTSGILRDGPDVLQQLPTLGDAVFSNEATFTVRAPTGADASVWQLIRDLPPGRYWRADLAATIAANYPASTYAAYAPADAPNAAPADAIARLNAAISRDANSSFAPWFRLTIARLKSSIAYDFERSGKADRAIATYDEARQIVESVRRDAKDPALISYADETARGILTRDDVERSVAASSGTLNDIRVWPLCTAKTADGKVLLWYAYNNPTDHELRYEVGANNKFTPPPFDRHQPTVFKPGYVEMAFSVPFDNPELTWHVAGANVTAKAKDVPDCGADDSPGAAGNH